MKKLVTLVTFLALAAGAQATHNRAGEITYRQISQYPARYEFLVVTYTKSSSIADRPEIEVDFGDGTRDTVPRLAIIPIAGKDMQRNEYKAVHTFPAPGKYVISVSDPNRNAGVLNIPNSVNISFYIETTLVISPFLGYNNSPVLLYPPVDDAQLYRKFVHNPNAWDMDGDSLSYKLVPCRMAAPGGGVDIPGYTLPDQIQPGPQNKVTLDAVTGDFVWDSPQQMGEYNVAILIEEWRNGKKIGAILRDMQIDVLDPKNDPPVIDSLPDFCVQAGDTVKFTVRVTDPNFSDKVTLTATGGPFQVPVSPADFPQPKTDSSVFTWNTACSHVRKELYSALFRAEDDHKYSLVDLESVSITVIGPAPAGLTATPAGISMVLNWNMSQCPEVTGYLIYRRAGCTGFVPGPCQTGVPPSSGYVLVGTVNGIANTTFVDNDNGKGLVHGTDYGYLVVAVYGNGALSYASTEACARLKKDVPIITNVSVNYTDASLGAMYVAWSKPTEIDTASFAGPYKYIIYRSAGFFGSSPVPADSATSLDDTTWVDTLLNTLSSPHSYRIDFYNVSPRVFIGRTQTASSVFLRIAPADNRLLLSWEEHVPWTNTTYVVHKWNGSAFVAMDTTTVPSYEDKSLVNGLPYCYKIESIGSYAATGIVDPIVNFSQEACMAPADTVPPCAPLLSVTPSCDEAQNVLGWSYPQVCDPEVVQYRIYHSPTGLEPWALLATYNVNGPVDSSFIHAGLTSMPGCYAVTALDSFANESPIVPVCTDTSCTQYRLPNVFTPNGDHRNDFFIPFPYRFVERIDISIYNRWGGLLFRTDDPDIKWDGRNRSNGKPCTDGVYYYVCKVYRKGLDGELFDTLTGFIHLIGQAVPGSK